jgi:hypothetical protein
MNAGQVLAALRQRGWKVFTRPFELNIVGLRSAETRPNSFDDLICVAYHDQSGRAVARFFPATTDPGTYWLRQPMNSQGTAILAQGQYLDAYGLGLHRGKYLALVQAGPVRVIRDYDRDAVLDFANGHEISGRFGINIHHASSNGTTKAVDKYSAGCQVFANIADFNNFMGMCQRHRELYGNRFTYSLIDARAIGRKGRKRIVAVGCAFALAAIALAIAACRNAEPPRKPRKQNRSQA